MEKLKQNITKLLIKVSWYYRTLLLKNYDLLIYLHCQKSESLLLIFRIFCFVLAYFYITLIEKMMFKCKMFHKFG